MIEFFNKSWQQVLSSDPISREREKELAKKMVNGSKEARDRLVEVNLRFVAEEAQRLVQEGVEFADLFQEGVKGLMYALDRYDPEAGTKVISYAVQPIRWFMWEYIEDFQNQVREPDPDPERVQDISFDEVQEENRTYEEVFPGNYQEDYFYESLLHEELNDLLMEALEGLREKDRRVLILAYGLDGEGPRTLDEVGLILGISSQRAGQRRIRALEELKEGNNASILKEIFQDV